jgi:hypothetical protein
MDVNVEPFRVDYYLSMPLEEELGIKVRDGKLEIKRCGMITGSTRSAIV